MQPLSLAWLADKLIKFKASISICFPFALQCSLAAFLWDDKFQLSIQNQSHTYLINWFRQIVVPQSAQINLNNEFVQGCEAKSWTDCYSLTMQPLSLAAYLKPAIKIFAYLLKPQNRASLWGTIIQCKFGFTSYTLPWEERDLVQV